MSIIKHYINTRKQTIYFDDLSNFISKQTRIIFPIMNCLIINEVTSLHLFFFRSVPISLPHNNKYYNYRYRLVQLIRLQIIRTSILTDDLSIAQITDVNTILSKYIKFSFQFYSFFFPITISIIKTLKSTNVNRDCLEILKIQKQEH